MVVLSEYTQIAVAGIYAIALFYTIVTFRRSKRLDEIGTLNGIMSDLRDLDREVTKIPSGSQNDEAKRSDKWFNPDFEKFLNEEIAPQLGSVPTGF